MVPGLPGDAELEQALESVESAPDNRRQRRFVRAVDRRSAREPVTPPDSTQLAARAARERTEDRRYRERLARRSADWCEAPASKRVKTDRQGRVWRLVPQSVWVMCKDVVSDTSGRAWRYWARQIRNKAALGAIRRAALLPIDGGSRTRRNWSDECARRIAALGLSLVSLAKHTDRKGPWCLIVKGIPVACLRWLLAYPVSRSIVGEAQREAAAKLPHWNTLIGRHRGYASDRERGTLGYLRCLEEAGLIAQTQQAYPNPAPWEQSDVICRPGMPARRFNMNRYWITSDASSTRHRTRKPELVELNREGWESLDEHPRRCRKRVLYTEKRAESGPSAAPS
jgi:hypothetical protein